MEAKGEEMGEFVKGVWNGAGEVVEGQVETVKAGK